MTDARPVYNDEYEFRSLLVQQRDKLITERDLFVQQANAKAANMSGQIDALIGVLALLNGKLESDIADLHAKDGSP